MKFSLIILLCACLQVSARGYAQSVTISERNAPLEKVFRYIEKQTGYVFFFDHSLIDKAARVNVNFKNYPLDLALDLCLKDQPLTYSIVGKNIVIKQKEQSFVTKIIFDAQQDTLIVASGKVTDDKGQGLPGASVMVKNSSTGTATDVNGAYKFKVPRGAVLVVSYIGYKSQETPVTGTDPINFVLAQSVSSTDEIVVIGYGTARKSDLTGSLSQIKSKDITSYPTTNIMQALSGRAPGVRVMQNNGSPGGAMSVRIRGVNSILGGNEPLYVIDGFPVSGNPTFLQNSDIASIEILKDASSTAIYGSRGANGIVMITTKSGRKKEQTSVDVEFGYTTQRVSKKMPLMNAQQYATLYNEQAKNDGLAPYFTQGQIDSLSANPGTDWQGLVLRDAPMFTASATVNGGTEKTKFSISGAAFTQDGIVRNSDYKRYNIRANVEHDISKIFTVNYNVILTRLNSNRKNQEPGNRGNDLISAMLMSPPSLTPYLPNGSYRRLNTAYPFISNVIVNPLVPLHEQSDLIKGDRVFANAALVIKPWKDLSIRISGGIENSNDRVDQYNNIEPSVNSVGSANVFTDQTTSLLNENVATYSKQFGKHTLNVTAGFTYQDYTFNTLRGSGQGFLSDITGTGNLGSANTPGIPGSGYNKWVLLSYLGRLNYNYNDKYLLTVSFRSDGSSRYSESNKWGNFPSAALAWRVSSEDFLKQSKVISDLKLRASYGGTGSTAVNPYQTLNQLSSSNTIFGDALYIAFAPGTTLPGDLRWETTRQFDAGMDIAFLRNALRFTADFYQKKTTNLLNNVQLPASMGYRTTVQNVGEIQNTGVELNLEADVLQGDVNWTLAGNIAFNRNKVLKLYNGQDIFGRTLYTGSLNDYVNLLREGQPLGIFYGYKEIGYTETGNLRYEDITKDGIISAEDKTYIGDPNPDFIYGLSSITAWKGFELTVFIQGSQGNDIFNLNKAASLDLGMGLNLPREVYEDHWTPENTNAKYPKITRNLAGNMSTRFVEDGSYLRFKNIQLAYNLPVRNFGWKWFKSAQVYASGQNLITFTKYSWYDPEINAYGGANSISQGIDYSTYPTNKSVTFGVRCGF
ncbi:TonB-dependent receptor [Chitinophaga barathri]|uniref:SusC/RagA family TonB-linked outer membrane protein n=1 Tax=Chitinophaga barathri TaxID=1647451 RepID=A0A3N4MS03_9BACT|nr:TonB-dependent receptor [Chitinophaga barathri]RPD42910.1 SusC/RagA family TonB-linked outer membrane protein [Chitinophaga barathri]